MQRLITTLIITFTGLVTAAIGVGAQRDLPAVRLTHGAFSTHTEIYVDAMINVTVTQYVPRPFIFRRDQVSETITYETKNGDQLTFDLASGHGFPPYYDLTVARGDMQAAPLDRPVHFTDGYHSGDDRFWYFLGSAGSDAEETLMQYDVETHAVKTVLEDVTWLHGCSTVDPQWCVIQQNTDATHQLLLFNLNDATSRPFDTVSYVWDKVNFSQWIPDTGEYLYTTRLSDGSNRTLVTYDPVANTTRTVHDLDGTQATITRSSDGNTIFVTSFNPDGSWSDTLIMSAANGDLPVVTDSVKAASPDFVIDIGSNATYFDWSPAHQTLIFVATDINTNAPNLYSYAAASDTITRLTHFRRHGIGNFALSPNENWVAFAYQPAFRPDALYVVPVSGRRDPLLLDSAPIDRDTYFNGWTGFE